MKLDDARKNELLRYATLLAAMAGRDLTGEATVEVCGQLQKDGLLSEDRKLTELGRCVAEDLAQAGDRAVAYYAMTRNDNGE